MKKFALSMGLLASLVFMGQVVPAQQGELLKVPHGINPNSNSPNFPGFQAPTGGTRKAGALVYHGGPLMTGTVKVYLIWYGHWNLSNGTDNAAGQQLVRDWASGISATPYFNLNTSLSVSGSAITGMVFYAGEATDAGTATSITDSDILSIVNRNVGVGKALPYDSNAVYFVVTSSDINKDGFCTSYCGWHTAGNIGAGHVKYSFVGNAARCINSCAIQTTSPNGNAGIDGAVSVLSHELEEAVTDPDLNAWFSRSGYENADECAWTFGHNQYQVANGSWANMNFGGHDWMIQRNILKTGSSFYCMVNSGQN